MVPQGEIVDGPGREWRPPSGPVRAGRHGVLTTKVPESFARVLFSSSDGAMSKPSIMTRRPSA